MTRTYDQQDKERLSQLMIVTDSASTLAKEHILCPPCQRSIIASRLLNDPSRGSESFHNYADVHTLEKSSSEDGCHLCSLFMGMIRHHLPTIGQITVTLHVSRSSGITFVITSGEAEEERRIGELVVVPREDIEEHDACVPADAKFTFPIRETFENAQLAKSTSSEVSFTLAREWLRQCLHRHPKCSQAAVSAKNNTYPSRPIDVGDGERQHLKVVVTEELNTNGLRYLTLSHCWGGADILRLLRENVDELTVEIPMEGLPKTFQDAMVITRGLGYVARQLVGLEMLTGISVIVISG